MKLPNLLSTGKQILRLLPNAVRDFTFFLRFFALLNMYLLGAIFNVHGRIKLLRPINWLMGPITSRLYTFVFTHLDPPRSNNLRIEDIIHLALGHLKAKKVRTFITIGGMAIGFGSVIFLLSIGYGFQRLVVSRVARLGEMKQIDIAVGQASALSFDDKTIQDISAFESVTSTIPLVSVVAKVSYNNSVSDVVAYGVTSDFLEESAIKPIKGEIFVSETWKPGTTTPAASAPETSGSVAGASIVVEQNVTFAQEAAKVSYSIHPQVWKPVYENPSLDGEPIGFTQRSIGQQEASEVWGDPYTEKGDFRSGEDARGNRYITWIQDSFALWEEKECSTEELDCTDGKHSILRDNGQQKTTQGYITQADVTLERYDFISTQGDDVFEGKVLRQVSISLPQDTWQQLYSEPSSTTPITGSFSKGTDTNTTLQASLVVGEYYYDESRWGYFAQNTHGKKLGYWIRAELPAWRKLDCADGCDNDYLMDVDAAQKQKMVLAYLPANQVTITEMANPEILGQVLGEATSSASITESTTSETETEVSTSASGSAEVIDDLEWVLIASQAGILQPKQKDVLPLASTARKEAIVNKAMLNLLGISLDEAINKTFDVTFVFDGKLFNKPDYLSESAATTYKIIGVTPEERTPAFYLPFSDLQSVGITNYSQLKVVVESTQKVADIRKRIESLGFKTTSVVDTVERINSLFDNIRTGLLLIGMIALSVAALGMFNTLTVSLLEKTREVGLMKAMGMKSQEVKNLFLAESLLLGFFGGVFGLLLGWISGKTLSILLSAVAVSNGIGALDVAYIPASLVLTILTLSFIVGIGTGLYPSYRATKISALNALRYE